MNAKSKAPRGGPRLTRRSDAQSSTNVDADESVLLNPKGRSTLDESKSESKTKLLSCKHHINVATMNVKTIRHEIKREELANNCKAQKVKILGIVDHKIVHEEDPIVYQSIGNHILITSSAWRNTANASCGGVGLMIDKTIESALAEVKPVNERIMIAHFIGNPGVTIVVHNLTMVIGDYNAHLGKEVGKYTYHDRTNSNGSRLVDFAQEAGLVISNIHLQKKNGKLWTYISDMSGTKSQVDFILVNKKWKNSIKNCEAYNSFSSMGSDHRIISAKVKLSLRTSKAPVLKPKYDWSALKDPTVSRLYTVAVRNKYEALCQDTETVSETYAHLIEANKEAAKEHKPLKKRTKRRTVAQDTRIEKARK
jgi:hypothetical protein